MRGSWARRLLVAICLVLLLAGTLWLASALYRVWQAGQAVKADLERLEAMVGGGAEDLDVEEAVALLHATRADLERLSAAARPFLRLAPYLGWLPRYGPDIQAGPALLEIALEVTRAGEIAVEPLVPLLERVQTGGTGPDDRGLLEEVTAVAAQAQPEWEEALAHVEAARSARDRVDAGRLSPRVRGLVDRLDRYLPLFERGLKGGLVLPRLLGADGRRVYLILVQNEDELRATGGFISGVARVAVEGGELLEVEFEDSYAVDDLSQPYPEPPSPLREYMLIDLWLFRDSNWSPDFPTSARTAMTLYAVGRDVVADGVIALDQQAIQRLVDALGPLEVEGYPEPVTGENVIRAAREAWAPGEAPADDWWRHRKDFMAHLLEAVLRRVREEPERVDPARLARAVLQSLERKDLLVYLQDEQAADLLKELGWDGAMRSVSGDYLMVVDTNMGFNKVNALVEESLEYVVDLTDPARPRAVLTVRHRHPVAEGESPCRQEPRYDPTYEQMTRRCYWDYLRVYVPPNSTLLAATPHPVPGEAMMSGRPTSGEVTVESAETGHQVFATFFLLPPGQALETRFEYLLPTDVLRALGSGEVEYTLTVQKQPGTRGVDLEVRLLLPQGADLATSDPSPASADGGEVRYALRLDTDRVLRVVLRGIGPTE